MEHKSMANAPSIRFHRSEESEEAVDAADHALVSRLKAKDETALDQLVATHGRELQRLIGRLTAWSADVEDLLQETLITVWKTIDGYRSEASFLTWVKAIAIRKCHNRNRGLRRFWKHLGLYRMHTESPPVREIEESPRWQQLHTAMRLLSDEDRELLVLYYLEEMGSQQLAILFSTTTNSIDVRLHRARKRLQKQIDCDKERS